jgi:putative ABC transport system ATP-binding protein
MSGEDTDKQAIISVRNVRHSYREGDGIKEVLHGVSLDFYAGEIVIIMGPSGSGKSTLLKLIGAQLTLQEGDVRVGEHELKGANADDLMRIRRDLGFIFQTHHLLDSISVLQNVELPLAFDDTATREVAKERALEALKTVGIEAQAYKKPSHLSGGQRQRVAIARALIRRPKIVLADEPTASLDQKSGREVVEIIRKMAKELGVTVVLVTHDNRILDIADRIVSLVDGRLQEGQL